MHGATHGMEGDVRYIGESVFEPFPGDSQECGWYIDGNSTKFGPLPARRRAPSTVSPTLHRAGVPPTLSKLQTDDQRLSVERTQERAAEKVANALLSEAKKAEARNHFARLTGRFAKAQS